MQRTLLPYALLRAPCSSNECVSTLLSCTCLKDCIMLVPRIVVASNLGHTHEARESGPEEGVYVLHVSSM